VSFNENAERYLVLENLRKAVDMLENTSNFSKLIPEIRTNIVMAILGARSVSDVAAVEGRITVVRDKPKAAGCIWFGASSHMARFLLERMKHDPEKRASIDIKFSEEILSIVEGIAVEKGLTVSYFEREKEPEEIRTVEGKTLIWAMEEAIKNAGGKIPDIIFDRGWIGKEETISIFGKDALEVAKIAIEIANNYHTEK